MNSTPRPGTVADERLNAAEFIDGHPHGLRAKRQKEHPHGVAGFPIVRLRNVDTTWNA